MELNKPLHPEYTMLKDIPGFEGKYQITEYGDVLSLNYNNTHEQRWLRTGTNSHGYLTINISMNNKKITRTIHRLVAMTYIPNPDNKPTIDHIDRNILNNHISNLRWATQSEQIYNQDHWSDKRKEVNKKMWAKAIEAHNKKVRCLETNVIYNSIREAEKDTGVWNQNISKVCKHTLKSAGGYHWEYVQES